MAKTIDERVVKMTFENQKFESGVKTTLSTLDKLKEKLNFGKSTESLNAFQKAANSLDLSSIGSAVDSVKEKFNVWEIAAIRVIQNITDRFTNMGINLVKSLSIDQITAGWGKFVESVASEQTILSAVEGKFDAEGNAYDMDAVLERVSKLQVYSDETSYSMNQMTTAIGSFTGAGVDLDVATSAIMGIANACADAGVSTQKAQSAFEGFSKAIASGKISLGQWNMQLKTSGLTNSEKFRNSLIDAGVAMGTLVKQGDKVYTVAKHTEVTAATLENTFNEEWATTEVMMKALSGYSDTVDALLAGGKLDLTTEAFKDLREAMEAQGYTQESLGLAQEFSTVSEGIEALTEAYKELGLEVPKSLKAFSRAQEAISFTQAIDSVKEAVSSGWSQTFETIFGNYEEGKSLWTPIANDLYSIFAESGNTRNEILETWKEMWAVQAEGYEWITGQSSMEDVGSSVTQIVGVYEALSAVVNQILEMFRGHDVGDKHFNGLFDDIFGVSDITEQAQKVFDAVEKVRLGIWDFYTWLIGGDYNSRGEEYIFHIIDLETALKGLLSVINILKTALTKIYDNLIKPLVPTFGTLLQSVLKLFSVIGSKITIFDKSFKESEKFGNNLSKIADILKTAIEFVTKLVNKLTELVSGVYATESSFNLLGSVLDFISKLANGFLTIIDSIKNGFTKLKELVGPMIDTLKEKFGGFKDQITEFLSNNSANLGSAVGGGILGYLLLNLNGLITKIKKLDLNNLTLNFKSGLVEKIKDTFDTLKTSLEDLANAKIKTEMIQAIAKSLLILAGALLVISFINLPDLAKAMGALTALLLEMFYMIKSVSKLSADKKDLTTICGAILKISTALVILSLALKILSTIGMEQMMTSLVGLGLTLIMLTTFLKSLVSLSSKLGFFGDNKIEALGKTVKAIGFGLIEIAAAMKIMGSMDIKQMGIALLGLVGVFGVLFGFVIGVTKLANTQTMGSFRQLSVIMLALGLSMIEIAAAMKIIATMEWGDLVKGLVGIAAVLASFFGLSVGISKLSSATDFAIISASMILMSSALLILCGALALLSVVNQSALNEAVMTIISIVAAFGILAVALSLIPGGTAAFAIVAASMLAISTSMLILAGALAVVSLLDPEKATKAIGILAKGLLALGGVSAVLGILSPLILLFSISLMAMAGAINLVAKAMISSVEAIVLYKMVSEDALEAMRTFFINAAATVIELIPMLIIGIVKAIIDTAAELVKCVIQIIKIICAAIKETVPTIIETVIVVLTSLVENAISFLRNVVPDIIALGFDILIALLEGFNEAIPLLVEGVFDILVTTINSVAEVVRTSQSLFEALGNLGSAVIEGLIGGLMTGLGTFGEKLKEFGAGVIQKIKDFFNGDEGNDENEQVGESIVTSVSGGIDKERDGLLENVENLSTDVVETMDKSEEAEGSGQNTLTGLISGLTNSDLLASIYESGVGAGSTFMAGYNSQMNINSPSKEMAKRGVYTIQGLIQGISSQEKNIKSAAEETASNMLNSLSYSIAKAESILEDDLNPVITPVLDLSNVESQARKLSGYFGSRSIKTAASINAINQNGGSGTSGSGSNNTVSVNFTVNKAGGELTDADIRKYGNTIAKVVNERLGFQV